MQAYQPPAPVLPALDRLTIGANLLTSGGVGFRAGLGPRQQQVREWLEQRAHLPIPNRAPAGHDFFSSLQAAGVDPMVKQREEAELALAVEVMEETLQRAMLEPTYQLECSTHRSLQRMARNGVWIDLARMTELRAVAGERQRSARQPLVAAFGETLDLESARDVTAAFAAQGITVAEHTLKGLRAAHHPLATAMADYTEQGELMAGCDTYLRSADRRGRIQPLWDSFDGYTGGLRSAFALPPAPALRACFTAPPGYTAGLFQLDDVPLRTLAYMASDAHFAEGFSMPGIDFGTFTAANVFRREPKLLTDVERRVGRAMNDTFPWGHGASQLMGCAKENYHVALTEKQAHHLHKEFDANFPDLKALRGKAWIDARDPAIVETRTLHGRRRLLPPATGHEAEWPRFAEIIETRSHGTADDGLKRGLVALDQAFAGRFTADGLVPFVASCNHQEVLAYLPTSQAAQDAKLIESTLAHVLKQMCSGKIPFVVSGRLGPSLADADLKPVTPPVSVASLLAPSLEAQKAVSRRLTQAAQAPTVAGLG